MLKVIFIFYCFTIHALTITDTSISCFLEETTDQEIADALNAHPHPERIKTIHLEEDILTDAALMAIGAKCPNLTGFHMHGNLITDQGIMALAQGCPHLKEIVVDTDAQGQITDNGVYAIAEHCPGLQWIHLGGHARITDNGIAALAEGCPGPVHFFAFSSVSMDGVWTFGRLTDASLIALATHCARLKRVDVSDQPCITVKGAKRLLSSCRTLTELGLSQTGISKKEAAALQKRYKKVAISI